MDQRLFIINELQGVAREIAPEPIRKENFIRLSKIPGSQLRKHFRGSDGPWKTALKEAGIESSPHRPPSLSEDELMDAIVELWRKVRRTPTHDDMNYLGSYSVQPYIARWGTFKNAIQHCSRSLRCFLWCGVDRGIRSSHRCKAGAYAWEPQNISLLPLRGF